MLSTNSPLALRLHRFHHLGHMSLAAHMDPLDEAFGEEEAEDEIVPSGMRVVEGDDDADLEEDAGVVTTATADEEEEIEGPKDGLAELDELEQELDEPPVDMGLDD